jgi:cytochrome b subunit of formate dehydrogenase
MRIVTWLLVLAGLGIAIAGGAAILGQAASGAQPWGNELSDNFVFIKAIPFVLGLGVVVGLLGGTPSRGAGATRPDGAVRRFSRTAMFLHWMIALGFLLALPTGVWQYLGGILDVNAPLPLYLFYRVHYVGAAIILFSLAAFLSHSWMSRDRSLLVPRGQWRTHLRGLMEELPRIISSRIAGLLGVNMRDAAPRAGTFTFYEKVVSFPSWTFVLVLITVTGLVKAARFGVELPGLFVFFNSTLHVTAMVIIVVKVLDHLRYTVARWPMMVAMVTGWLPPRRPDARRAPTPEPTGSSPAGALGGSDS